jgi:hypothetical protein
MQLGGPQSRSGHTGEEKTFTPAGNGVMDFKEFQSTSFYTRTCIWQILTLKWLFILKGLSVTCLKTF